MKRRNFIKSATTGALAIALPTYPNFAGFDSETRFGVAEASYFLRSYGKAKSEKIPPFADALEMIVHCNSLGFKGAQINVRNWDTDFAKKVRASCDQLNFFLEGQIGLPKSQDDLERFEKAITTGKEAGATIFRTACLSGRRYETFNSLAEFNTFQEESIASIRLAEPVMRKHKVKLAVENHKDWRAEEMVQVLKSVESEWIGLTLDTGNNLSLLEDPIEVVNLLAPYAISVHLKDMAVDEYEDGFLMSEVNLGDGFLDIEGMIKTIRKHNPEIKFNLEMITRDPLKIPCLTKNYWETFHDIPGSELAQFLHKIKKQKSKVSLPVVSHMTLDEQLTLEVENNRTSLLYAKEKYGFK